MKRLLWWLEENADAAVVVVALICLFLSLKVAL